MQQVAAAMQAGDFAGAHALLDRTDDARTEVGIAVGAYLLALVGRYEDADRQVASINAPAVKTLVRGEWRRAARWAIEANAAQLPTAANLPYLALYVEMAVALLRRDAALVDRVKADMAVQVPKRPGRLTFVDGRTHDFGELLDADDAIGAMLEAYVGDGVLYFPFATIRRVELPPPRNLLDLFTPLALVHLLDGQVATVAVPLLHARSSTSDDAALRSGRTTTFDFVGDGRRAIGMRDFEAGGALIGMGRVASIDFAP
jgi:protein involved in temperature-dependent protein secretion